MGNVVVGEFVPFGEHVEVAVLSGEQVEACVESLGTASNESHLKALREGSDYEIDRATVNLRALFTRVEEIELSVRVVVASSTGALALRNYYGEIDHSVFEDIGTIDNNNAIFIGDAETVGVILPA